MNGSCLIVKMRQNQKLSILRIEAAVRFLRKLGSDVQIAKINNQIIFAVLGGDYDGWKIREIIRPERMEFGTLNELGYENFAEAHEFVAKEESGS